MCEMISTRQGEGEADNQGVREKGVRNLRMNRIH